MSTQLKPVQPNPSTPPATVVVEVLNRAQTLYLMTADGEALRGAPGLVVFVLGEGLKEEQ